VDRKNGEPKGASNRYSKKGGQTDMGVQAMRVPIASLETCRCGPLFRIVPEEAGEDA